MMYIRLDVHKQLCYGIVMDEKGKVVKLAKFTNALKGLEEFMEGFDEAQVAMEASYCWQQLYDQLEEPRYGVRLAHPLKVKSIA